MTPAGNGAQLLAFVENALGLSAAEITRALEHTPDVVLRRADDVADLLTSSWPATPLEVLEQALPEGELWPVAPLSLGDPYETAHRQYEGWMTGGGARRRTIKDVVDKTTTHTQGLLLYAHGVCVPNPLRRYFSENDGLNERDLLVAVGEIARLAPLLEGGVLSVFDPIVEDDVNWLQHPEYGQAMRAIRDEAEELLGALGLSNIERTSIANVLIERVLWQLRQQATDLLAARPSGALFFDEPIERALFERISSVGEQAASLSDASLRLHDLIDLRLPGVADIKLREMVHIRDDDSFGTFRGDLRRALMESRPSLHEGDLASARLIVREHMQSGADRLKAATSRGLMNDVVKKNSLGWLLGAAMAASVNALSGAMTMALGRLATELVAVPKSTSALRAHYVALAKPVDASQADIRLGARSSVEALVAATQRRRSETLMRIADQLRASPTVDVPDAEFMTTIEEFDESIPREDLRLLSWLCVGWVQRELTIGERFAAGWAASKGTPLLERVAVIGVTAAHRESSASLALAARPALNWLLLRATTEASTSMTPEDVQQLNSIAVHWRRWHFAD